MAHGQPRLFFFLLFAVSPRFSWPAGRPCLSVPELDEAGCCCPHALMVWKISVPRTCVALFLSLLVSCYYQYSSLCHHRFNFFLYSSVSCSYRRRLHLRWRFWILLWTQLHGQLFPSACLFVNAAAPGRFASRWLSAHPRSGALARRRRRQHSARLIAAARLGMQGRRRSTSDIQPLMRRACVLFEIWICGVKREDFCKQYALMKTEILCMK